MFTPRRVWTRHDSRNEPDEAHEADLGSRVLHRCGAGSAESGCGGGVEGM
jgi:hypothetical protein